MMDNPSRFALYWTKVDENTFTVNVTGHVTVADGRHILVADLWQMEQSKAEGWDIPHNAEFQVSQNICLKNHFLVAVRVG